MLYGHVNPVNVADRHRGGRLDLPVNSSQFLSIAGLLLRMRTHRKRIFDLAMWSAAASSKRGFTLARLSLKDKFTIAIANATYSHLYLSLNQPTNQPINQLIKQLTSRPTTLWAATHGKHYCVSNRASHQSFTGCGRCLVGATQVTPTIHKSVSTLP